MSNQTRGVTRCCNADAMCCTSSQHDHQTNQSKEANARDADRGIALRTVRRVLLPTRRGVARNAPRKGGATCPGNGGGHGELLNYEGFEKATKAQVSTNGVEGPHRHGHHAGVVPIWYHASATQGRKTGCKSPRGGPSGWPARSAVGNSTFAGPAAQTRGNVGRQIAAAPDGGKAVKAPLLRKPSPLEK